MSSSMDHQELRRRFATLTTAHLADACLRAQVPVRCAPAPLSTVMPGSRLAGRVAPAQHVGSVDLFLEALQGAAPGDVLVVDTADDSTKPASGISWRSRLRLLGWRDS